MTCPTERAVAANLFFSFGTVDDSGEVTLQPHDLRRMLQSMGVVSVVSPRAPVLVKGGVGCPSRENLAVDEKAATVPGMRSGPKHTDHPCVRCCEF